MLSIIDSRSVICTNLFLFPTFHGVGSGRLCVSRSDSISSRSSHLWAECPGVLCYFLDVLGVFSGAAAFNSCVSDVSFFFLVNLV